MVYRYVMLVSSLSEPLGTPTLKRTTLSATAEGTLKGVRANQAHTTRWCVPSHQILGERNDRHSQHYSEKDPLPARYGRHGTELGPAHILPMVHVDN
jgi:hypothetical protein